MVVEEVMLFGMPQAVSAYPQVSSGTVVIILLSNLQFRDGVATFRTDALSVSHDDAARSTVVSQIVPPEEAVQ
jgi:hypothetical protein